MSSRNLLDVQETVSLEEAAELLGVDLAVMRALLKHQRVPGAYDMDDEGWLIPRASITAFAAERDAESNTGAGTITPFPER